MARRATRRRAAGTEAPSETEADNNAATAEGGDDGNAGATATVSPARPSYSLILLKFKKVCLAMQEKHEPVVEMTLKNDYIQVSK